MRKSSSDSILKPIVEQVWKGLDTVSSYKRATLEKQAVGTVRQAGDGVARIVGLPHVKSGEVVRIEGNVNALALDLEPDSIDALLLDHSPTLSAGARVFATGEVVHVPV